MVRGVPSRLRPRLRSPNPEPSVEGLFIRAGVLNAELVLRLTREGVQRT